MEEPWVLAWAALSVVSGGASLAVLAVRRRTVRGTTLAAVWAWHAVAVIVLASAGAAFVLIGADSMGRTQPVRFAAAVALFCPHMALLGAKRPQDRAWSWVVVSFWVVLALPALEVAVLRPGQSLGIRDLRGAFLGVFILMECVNRLGTGAWLSGVAFSIVQTMLLAEHLPFVRTELGLWAWPVASTIWFVGTAVMAWAAGRSRRGVSDRDRVWLAFRDAFGVLWALRAAERLNSVAQHNGWPVRLAWNGLVSHPSPATHGDLSHRLAHLAPDSLDAYDRALEYALAKHMRC
ncbi:MAG: hypothetical protein FJ297_17255 [Planctomycetes bacterium]|nr:hypothetical protein [Planctomycetota bacterium]